MIAYKVYQYLKQKQISKAVTAQIFSEILIQNKEQAKEKILKDEYLKYIVDAINNATGKTK